MKTVVTTLALVGSVCLALEVHAQSASASNREAVARASARVDAEAAADAQADEIAESVSASSDRAVKRALRAVDAARTTFAFADTDINEPTEVQNVFEDGFGFAVNPPGRGSNQPLIIRGANMDSNAVSNIQEDLAVMSRILNKTIERGVGRDGRDSAMGIVLSALPGAKRPQSIYLEGYGALFMASVKFPLVPPPAKDDEKAEKQVDTTWEQTKRELYGQKTPNVRVWNVSGNESTAEYNAEQVENLKSELIEALKNGGNIRDVKPDESITVAVIGNRASSTVNRVKHISRNSGKTGKSELYLADGPRSTARESTMTLRAKKSDVDAYANGSIDLEQFKKRVNVATY